MNKITALAALKNLDPFTNRLATCLIKAEGIEGSHKEAALLINRIVRVCGSHEAADEVITISRDAGRYRSE